MCAPGPRGSQPMNTISSSPAQGRLVPDLIGACLEEHQVVLIAIKCGVVGRG